MDSRRLVIFFLIILVLAGIAMRFYAIDKDFSAEESDFINSAKAIFQTGHARYYLSEQQPSELGLWHPPMYIFMLSSLFNFGISEAIARSINIVFSILTAFLIYLFCTTFLKEKAKLIGLFSSAFFLLNYYVLSSSILIDIDMLSAFFALSFVFFILFAHKKNTNLYYIPASISLFFSIFNRYPIAFLIFVGLGIYIFFNKDLKKSFPRYFLTGIISLAAFLLIWGFYSTFVEPGTFFSFFFHNARLGGSQFSSFSLYISTLFLNIAQFIRLFTLPACILLLFSIFYFARKRNHVTNTLLLYSISIFILFLIIPRPAFGYPRYFLTAVPAFSILISIFIIDNIKKVGKKHIFVFILSFIVSLLILILLSPQPIIYSGNGLIKATNLPDFIFNIFASIPLLLVLFYKKDKKVLAILCLIALVLSYSLYFNISFLSNDTSTKEAGLYIKSVTSGNEIIIAPKAVAYYAERRYYQNDNNKPELNFSSQYLYLYFKKSLENPKMDDEFFWPKGFYSGFYNYPSAPDMEKVKEVSYAVLYHPVSGFSPEKKIGDFYIYKIDNNRRHFQLILV